MMINDVNIQAKINSRIFSRSADGLLPVGDVTCGVVGTIVILS
jgi:hypothetical protein